MHKLKSSQRYRRLFPLALVLVVSAALGLTTELFLSDQMRPSVELSVVSFERASPSALNRARVVLRIENRLDRTVQILGLVRSDCGNETLSDALPIELGSYASIDLPVFVELRDPLNETSIPVKVFANASPFTHRYSLIIGAIVESGVPTLAPAPGMIFPPLTLWSM